MYERQKAVQTEKRLAEQRRAADERAEVARVINQFFRRMAAAGNPGLVDIWESTGSGKFPELKRRTPPQWQGWLLGEVSFEITVDRDGYGTATAIIGVTPNRQWLSISKLKARDTRWVATKAYEDATSVHTISQWRERMEGIAARLRRCATSSEVSLD